MQLAQREMARKLARRVQNREFAEMGPYAEMLLVFNCMTLAEVEEGKREKEESDDRKARDLPHVE